MSLYTIWRIEKSIWLDGPSAHLEVFDPKAILSLPDNLKVNRASDVIDQFGSARTFETVTFLQRSFIEDGNVIAINYIAEAKHPRYRRHYYARCTTSYVKRAKGWKLVAHHHTKLLATDVKSLGLGTKRNIA